MSGSVRQSILGQINAIFLICRNLLCVIAFPTGKIQKCIRMICFDHFDKCIPQKAIGPAGKECASGLNHFLIVAMGFLLRKKQVQITAGGIVKAMAVWTGGLMVLMR